MRMLTTRPLRHATTEGLESLDASKSTFTTPAAAETLRRTMTLPAPAPDEYYVITGVRAEMAFDGSVAYDTDLVQPGVVRVRALSKVVGHDGAPVQTVERARFSGGPTDPPTTVTDCTTDTFTADRRGVPLYVGAPGAAVSVEFYMSYSASFGSTVSSYCLRNTRIEYKRVRLTRRGHA